MSYRSFKRVLGETSLERKCRFLFGACLLLLITASFWWYGEQTEKLIYKRNRTTGRVLVEAIMGLRHMEKLETREEFKEMVQSASESLRNQEYTWNSLRPEANRAPRDAIERAVLQRFKSGRAEEHDDGSGVEWTERHLPKHAVYEYYQAVRARGAVCVSCHQGVDRNPDLAENDLIAVIKVTIPDAPTQADLNYNKAVLLSTAIITVFLAMIAAYIIVRYVIVKPLKHLRDVSDAISHGDIQQRAEIRTGDEFEELGLAFNRMLRHLVAAQDDLLEANTSLDTKVDELAQLNMRLMEMNQLKSQFLTTMSHELRTPLNSIIGFSDVLSSIKSLDEKQQRYVLNIQKSGKMLLDMINDILDLAKIESGKMDVRLAAFRIEHVIGAQCDMAKPLAEKKNIDLETVIAPRLPELYQDQGKVQQILNNLLSNAIKFTPEGGRIVISARQNASGELELVVSDTGVGIAPEDQTQIFEKFRQGETVVPSGDPLTREYSGTGLGLSIVRELCRLLGGDVTLQSEVGRGSTFTVRLPFVLARSPRLQLATPKEELVRAFEYERTQLAET
ncbi:MAG: HAMP domain-containing histidine kinase [Pirellulales bacterium]|nr:HAMP domain-containing histidine kinase [Pirellulales bacterium]